MLIEINEGHSEFYWQGGLRWPFIGLAIGRFSCGLQRDERKKPCSFMSGTEVNARKGTVLYSYELGRWSAFIELPSKSKKKNGYE